MMKKLMLGAVMGFAGLGIAAPKPVVAQNLVVPGLEITIGWDRGGYHVPRRHYAPPPRAYYTPPSRYYAPRRVYVPPPVYYVPSRPRARWDRPVYQGRPRHWDRPRYRHW